MPVPTATVAASAPPDLGTAAPAAERTEPPATAPPADSATPVPRAPVSAGTAAPAAAATPVAPATAIYSASASPEVVHAGQTVTWSVATTPDVTDVQANVSVYHFSLTRAGAGRFVMSFSIPPNVPPFFHGHYDVQLIAHGTGSASGALAVDFQ